MGRELSLDKELKMSLIEMLMEIQKEIYKERVDPDALLKKLGKVASAIAHKSDQGQTKKLYDILKETFVRIDDFHDRREDRLTGLPTGYCDLDDITGGLQASELIILAGRPGMGKTSLALNILENIGVEQGKASVLFSLEISAQQIGQNMVCSHAKVDAYNMRRGTLHDHDWQKLILATGRMADAPIFINDTPGLSISEIKSEARQLKAKHDIQFIVIDYLQLLHSPQEESRL
ncbi:MAG: replicative DNA helicase, partial [Candidatus Anammoxibacter sp.]